MGQSLKNRKIFINKADSLRLSLNHIIDLLTICSIKYYVNRNIGIFFYNAMSIKDEIQKLHE